MESVAEIAGVAFVNDTTATAPIATVAALRGLAGRRVHLIAGGADKSLDPTPLASVAADYAHRVYLLAGTATPGMERALSAAGVTPIGPFSSMAEAVDAAAANAAPGDVVLLSPGCASFGLFRDEFDRGERFREAVRALANGPLPNRRPGGTRPDRGRGAPARSDEPGGGRPSLSRRGGATSGAPPSRSGEGSADGARSRRRLPPPPARVHFVGIGGIGMSGLARILQAWGYRVTGSDAAASAVTAALDREGISVTIGHTATDAAAAADLVVVTAAVRGDNPELAAAGAAGVPVVKRAALLGLLANARRCVAVAGSHGKSTTSGMLVDGAAGARGRPELRDRRDARPGPGRTRRRAAAPRWSSRRTSTTTPSST